MKPIVRLLINKEFYNLDKKTFWLNSNEKTPWLDFTFCQKFNNKPNCNQTAFYVSSLDANSPIHADSKYSFVFRNQMYKFCKEKYVQHQ